MRTHIIEATNGPNNWGKFLLGVFDDKEIDRRSEVSPPDNLLRAIGWNPRSVWVLDLQTGEGAVFNPAGHAKADLDHHQIWVCPLFEPFLEWLYTNSIEKIHQLDLPRHVDLPTAPFEFRGYRRSGR
jgi:hypothetical protein